MPRLESFSVSLPIDYLFFGVCLQSLCVQKSLKQERKTQFNAVSLRQKPILITENKLQNFLHSYIVKNDLSILGK